MSKSPRCFLCIFFKIQGGFANMSPIEYSYCMGSLQELGIDLDSITDPKIKKAIVLLFNSIQESSLLLPLSQEDFYGRPSRRLSGSIRATRKSLDYSLKNCWQHDRTKNRRIPYQLFSSHFSSLHRPDSHQPQRALP